MSTTKICISCGRGVSENTTKCSCGKSNFIDKQKYNILMDRYNRSTPYEKELLLKSKYYHDIILCREPKHIKRQYKHYIDKHSTLSPTYGFTPYKSSGYISQEQKKEYISSITNPQSSNANSTVSDSVPHCPACNSTNVTKISIAKKATGFALIGIFSSNFGKTMHCKNCGYKW